MASASTRSRKAAAPDRQVVSRLVRFVKGHKAIVAGVVIVALVALVAMLAPVLSPYSPTKVASARSPARGSARPVTCSGPISRAGTC